VAIAGILCAGRVTSAGAERLVGFRAGASVASQSTDGEIVPGVTWRRRTGAALGMCWDVALSRRIGLRMEPMYVQKGTEVRWPAALEKFDNLVAYDYLCLPVNLKLLLGVERIRPFVFGGPDAGVAISTRAVLRKNGRKIDIVSRSFDLSMDVGGGLELAVRGNVVVVIDARYSRGLADIDGSPDVTMHNRAWIFLAGISTPF
jgi:opacity protein-like surface antigen